MDYTEILKEYEQGVDWRNWSQSSDKDILEMRLAALLYREAKCKEEAKKLHREATQLNDLLMTM